MTSDFLRIVIADRISQVVKRGLLDMFKLSFLKIKEKKDQKHTEVELKEDKKVLSWGVSTLIRSFLNPLRASLSLGQQCPSSSLATNSAIHKYPRVFSRFAQSLSISGYS